ncbi:MAG: ribosome biogenesis GTPase Der [candidate division WOR-3 bacterium]|nr:ribosome biogenesis GTPase Der [candidate division WOR-3 bacterium]MCX7947533.1 ribosome biogenesis GTPase Der [candidate division WOR-3 bacterium]MDW8150419.1 ribosome biogenesis GTPase Der [candidate division WOR-3 bacterium]
MKRLPRIVIVGRANVGKSTLFNKLIKKPFSIVKNQPAITRDRITKIGYWLDWSFYLTDTGGLLDKGEMEVLYDKVLKSIEKAIEKADIVIFLTDGTVEPMPMDYEIANILRKYQKPVFLAVNKSDVKNYSSYEYYKLGFDKVYEISAEHKLGINALFEDITEYLKVLGFEALKGYKRLKDKPRVSIIGKVNVGKSSLLNALVGEEISIVSDIPGTTRDSVDVETKEFIFIDTAGIKKKFKDDIEYYSYVRTSRSIKYAEVLIAVLDASKEITKIDKKVVGLAKKSYKALIVALNKADLIKNINRKKVFEYFKKNLEFSKWAPMIFVSAKTGENLELLKEIIKKVYKEYNRQLKKDELLDTLSMAFEQNKPTSRIYEIKQIGHKPPTFKFVVDKNLKNSYIQYIESALRKKFGFYGTPIKIVQELK